MTVRVLLAVAALLAGTSAITQSEVNTVRTVCRQLMEADRDRIAGFVRLIFHDCVGGCNGCINLGLTESNGDLPNNGLRRYINALENNRPSGTMSKADYWAICAQEAVIQGRRIAENDPDAVIDIPMEYGRTDCTNPQNTDNLGKFPNPRQGLQHVLTWCSTTFGLNNRECVALMGAHSLGRARRGASGYDGPWDRSRDGLDNDYYREMVNRQWQQRNVDTGPEGNGSRWQYDSNDRRQLMMLNTDMCLLKNIAPDAFGRVVANLADVGDSSTANDVRDFSSNNEGWITDFAAVFTKMIKHGASTSPDIVADEAPLQAMIIGGARGGGRGGRGGGNRRRRASSNGGNGGRGSRQR